MAGKPLSNSDVVMALELLNSFINLFPPIPFPVGRFGLALRTEPVTVVPKRRLFAFLSCLIFSGSLNRNEKLLMQFLIFFYNYDN